MSNYRHGTNYYEILEVNREAPQNEIHKAYQRAKATYSAENPALYSMFSKEEARELVRMIEEAYAVLGNQALRKNYDQTLMIEADQKTKAASPTNGPANGSSHPAVPRPLGHNELPDFNPPEAGSAAITSEGYTVRKKEQTSSLPSGSGRTPVSTYQLNDEMDADIANRVEWDGTALQKVRLYKNVTIDQVSEASRVSRTYLMAVETNDYKNLPAPVFVRGFVVQIARMLGLDENKVAGSYMKIMKEKTAK